MGRGDKRTKKGKISIGSYGVSRSRKAIKSQLKRANSKPAPVVEALVVAEKPKVKRVVKKKETATE